MPNSPASERCWQSAPAFILLDLLSQGENPVETLAEQTGLSVPNVSDHLRELRMASLVQTRRAGRQIYYRLASLVVLQLVRSLQDVSHESLAEVRELVSDFYQDPDGLEAVDMETLNRGVQEGEAILMDVRPPDEWAARHIPGAVSISIDELEDRLKELPQAGRSWPTYKVPTASSAAQR
ncbi:MAG: ArsR family transcriptional regulator [Gemmatimonadales bacterium]|nr:MAG: ArsR family transcriptional regulator [Gemmatimonadales bacterium]